MLLNDTFKREEWLDTLRLLLFLFSIYLFLFALLWVIGLTPTTEKYQSTWRAELPGPFWRSTYPIQIST